MGFLVTERTETFEKKPKTHFLSVISVATSQIPENHSYFTSIAGNFDTLQAEGFVVHAKAIRGKVMTTMYQTITCCRLSIDKCQIGGCFSPAANV